MYLMATTMVHIRVDEKLKQKAGKALAAMGMSVSDAVRLLLVRVAAEQALPFEIRVPNPTTIKALQAAEKRKGKKFASPDALFKDLGISRPSKPYAAAPSNSASSFLSEGIFRSRLST